MTAAAERVAQRSGGKRRRGREMALQMLFQCDLGGATVPQVIGHFDPFESAPDGGRESVEVTREAFAYAKRLVEGTIGKLDELDGLIREQAENWRLERMSAVDRNVLRLAAYELLYELDVPKLVVIDEAIELAKRFGSEQSGRFVNGLLDGLIKGRELPGRLT